MQPDWSRATNWAGEEKIPILPTVVTDQDGTLLCLVWSSERSLAMALEKRLGIYESRRRGLWVKSPSGVNAQRLISYSLDCDGDALHFVVAQRGEACHLERKSCFQQVWTDCEPLRIGICSGRGKQAAIQLLEQVGIHLYSDAKARSTEYLVKSHLHPKIEIVECKPRDLEPLLSSRVINIAVGFDDKFEKIWQIRSSAKSKQVEIVVFGRRGPFERVFTEYPIEKWSQWKTWSNSCKTEIIPISGNAEAFVHNDPKAIGVGVVDSGETLAANGLVVLGKLIQSKCCLFFSDELYAAQPRLFRSISNDLESEVIYFYSVDGPNGFMSNFYPTKQKSSEHQYQAAKYLDPKIRELILSQPTAKEACKVGRANEQHLREDWFSPCDCPIRGWKGEFLVKDQCMWQALLEKFSDPDLMEKLLSTGSKKLVEHALRDPHFGCGIDGQGKNVLGRLLMHLRDILY